MKTRSFDLTLHVIRWMQIRQAFFALPFTIGSILFLVQWANSSWISLIGLFFCAFFAYSGWANALSTIHITDKSVTVAVFYGRFRIYWNEVRKIIREGSLVALISDDKRVVLSAQLMDQNAAKMFEYFDQQVNERKIEYTTAEKVPLTHRNSRLLI
jgi:hypothetical protein